VADSWFDELSETAMPRTTYGSVLSECGARTSPLQAYHCRYSWWITAPSIHVTLIDLIDSKCRTPAKIRCFHDWRYFNNWSLYAHGGPVSIVRRSRGIKLNIVLSSMPSMYLRWLLVHICFKWSVQSNVFTLLEQTFEYPPNNCNNEEEASALLTATRAFTADFW